VTLCMQCSSTLWHARTVLQLLQVGSDSSAATATDEYGLPFALCVLPSGHAPARTAWVTKRHTKQKCTALVLAAHTQLKLRSKSSFMCMIGLIKSIASASFCLPMPLVSETKKFGRIAGSTAAR
jgi:hypothetical protein